jgi:hypothetical protein
MRPGTDDSEARREMDFIFGQHGQPPGFIRVGTGRDSSDCDVIDKKLTELRRHIRCNGPVHARITAESTCRHPGLDAVSETAWFS